MNKCLIAIMIAVVGCTELPTEEEMHLVYDDEPGLIPWHFVRLGKLRYVCQYEDGVTLDHVDGFGGGKSGFGKMHCITRER